MLGIEVFSKCAELKPLSDLRKAIADHDRTDHEPISAVTLAQIPEFQRRM